MTDLVEAAARATCARQLYATVWDTLNDGSQDSYRAAARAALLAALEAVEVEEVAVAIHTQGYIVEAVLAHLRKLVEEGE